MTMTKLETCSFSERLAFLSLTRAASSYSKTMNSLQSDRHPLVTMKKIENCSFCERLSDDETFSLLHLLALTFAVVDSSTHVFSLTQAVFSWSQTKKLLQTQCCPLTTMKKIAAESFSARLVDDEPISPLHWLIVELVSSICLLTVVELIDEEPVSPLHSLIVELISSICLLTVVELICFLTCEERVSQHWTMKNQFHEASHPLMMMAKIVTWSFYERASVDGSKVALNSSADVSSLTQREALASTTTTICGRGRRGSGVR